MKKTKDAKLKTEDPAPIYPELIRREFELNLCGTRRQWPNPCGAGRDVEESITRVGTLAQRAGLNHRDLSKVKGTLFGRSFWARGYCVSTVGIDELSIRQYIQDQEQHQQNLEQYEINP